MSRQAKVLVIIVILILITLVVWGWIDQNLVYHRPKEPLWRKTPAESQTQIHRKAGEAFQQKHQPVSEPNPGKPLKP